MFLIAGMLLPSALQAKQLLDFCMTEMSHHEMMMDGSHDCCLPVANHHSGTQEINHDCENGQICACPVGEVPAQNQSVVPANSTSGIILSQAAFNFTLTPPDEIIHNDLTPASNQYSPPLYLLYDTFLN